MLVSTLVLFSALLTCCVAQSDAEEKKILVDPSLEICIKASSQKDAEEMSNLTKQMKTRPALPGVKQPLKDLISEQSVAKAMRNRSVKKKLTAWDMPLKPAKCAKIAIPIHGTGWHWLKECPAKTHYIDIYYDWGLNRVCRIINSCLNRVWMASCQIRGCCGGKGHCRQSDYHWVYFLAYCPPSLSGPIKKPWKYVYVRRLYLPHCCSCYRCVLWKGK